MLKYLFYLYAGLLYGLSLITGLSYKVVSVYINVYLQAILLLFSALWLFFVVLRLFRHRKILFFSILLWVSLQLALFVVFAKRYFFLPKNLVFDQTMKSLEKLAAFLGTTYMDINIVLYVLVYGAIILINYALVKLIKNLSTDFINSDNKK